MFDKKINKQLITITIENFVKIIVDVNNYSLNC